MLYAQYCLNLLSITNNVVCGCTCGEDRSLLVSGCENETRINSPRVMARPSNLTIDEGGSATFSCRASGELLTGLEWQDSTGRRLESSRGTLSFTAARKSDEGRYTCVAYNYLGGRSSESVYLYVRQVVTICELRKPCSDICEVDRSDRRGYRCSCPSGMELGRDRRTCVVSPCQRSNHCSPVCMDGYGNAGKYACRCPSGMVLSYDWRTCTAVNTCARHNPKICSDTCVNDPSKSGGYYCACRTGRVLNSDRRTCRDVDVCARHNPKICSDTCVNDPSKSGGYYCACRTGRILNSDRRTCRDVDVCARHNPKICSDICVNDPSKSGGYYCACRTGRVLNSNRRTCRDVDVCARHNPKICSDTCVNDPSKSGGYYCACRTGRVLNSNRRTCRDVDVCARHNPKICSDTCVNDPSKSGGYYCACRTGRVLNSNRRTCRDVDVCARQSPKICSDICVDDPSKTGGYYCACRTGRILNRDGRTCRDVDTCGSLNPRVCSDLCVNDPTKLRGYYCDCRPGRVLDGDRRTCRDISICTTGHRCSDICVDDLKSSRKYRCECRAGRYLSADGFTCRPLIPLQVQVNPLVKRIEAGGSGSITCSSIGGVGRHTRTWAPVVINSRFVNSVFTITNANERLHERKYTCTVTDEAGQTRRATADVFISSPPNISVSVNPKYASVRSGGSTTITCTVSGGGNARHISWTRSDGQSLRYNIKTRSVTAYSSRLDIENASPDNAGDFVCRYDDGAVLIQDTAKVTVVIPPNPEPVTVTCTSSVTLFCFNRDGGPMKSVSWKFNNKDISNPGISLNREGDQLTIDDVDADDEGIYTCDGTTAHTKTSTYIKLLVTCPPTVSAAVWLEGEERGSSLRKFLVGQTVILSCNATGRPDIHRVYWKKRGGQQRIATETTAVSDGRGNEKTTLRHVMSGVGVDDGGIYECHAENSVNNTIRTVHFDVIPDPPTVNVVGGGLKMQNVTVVLRCVVTSTPQYGPMEYSWTFTRRDGESRMPSDVIQRGDSLRITKVNFIHEGRYTCRVTDRHRQRSSPEHTSITVNGTLPPPESIGVLHCSVPVGADFIEWKRSSGKSLPAHAVQEGEHGEKLIISPTYAEDADEYYCCATNSRGSAPGCTNTGPISAPPKVEIVVREPRGRPPTYLEGRELHLECIITIPGYPVAQSVTWTKDGAPVFRARNRAIRIEKMVMRDQGVYKCEASNGQGLTGSDDKEIRFGCVRPSHVKVNVGPTHTEGYLIGKSVLWTCEAEGSPTPDYVWYKTSNPRNILSRQSSLTVSPVSRQSAGTYTCKATNRCGYAEATEMLRIKNRRPETPRIFPTGQKYLPGDLVTITCVDRGGFPRPTLTWYRGRDVIAVSREGRVELRFDSFDEVHTDRYECRATNTEGDASAFIDLSLRCSLRVPTITRPSRVFMGSNINMTCSAGDSDPPPSYLWRKRGVEVGNLRTWSITNADPFYDNGEYTCEVSNTECGQTESRTTTIEVLGVKPVVSIESCTASPQYGDDVRCTCKVTAGDPAPTLQWMYNERRVTTVRETSDSVVLILDDISADEAGRYLCVGTNTYGENRKHVTIGTRNVVPDDLEITGKQEYKEGEMIDLQCRLIGPMPRPPLSLVWVVNGRQLAPMKGVRSISFRQRMAENMKGTYECRLFDENFNMNKRIIIDMTSTPVPPPLPPRITGPSGEVIFVGEASVNRWECRAAPGATIIWRSRNNKFVPPDFIPSPHNVFRVTKAALTDTDIYYCVARNSGGESGLSNSVNITVIHPPGTVRIEKSPAPNAEGGRYMENTPITLRCFVDGLRNTDRRFFEWRKSSAVVSTGSEFGFTVSERDSGTYQCIAKYSNGDIIDQATVFIGAAQRQCPDSATISGVSDDEGYVRQGSTVTLTCDSEAYPNPRYSWTKNNGLPISTSRTLQLRTVSQRDEASYTCIVTVAGCPTGARQSQRIRLIRDPTIISHYPSGTVITPMRDTSFSMNCTAEGIPTPSIRWTYNGGPVPAVATDMGNGVLVISRMSSSYDGIYACVASHRFSPPSDKWEWMITTKNLYPPTRVRVVPAISPRLYYGQRHGLTCTADGEQITFIWKYRQFGSFRSVGVQADSIENVEVTPMESGYSVLNFTSLDDSNHNGFFWCEAVNDAGRADSNLINITVSVEPKVKLDCPSHGDVICLQSISAGDSLELTCSAFSKYPPQYRWANTARRLRGSNQVYRRENIEVQHSDDYMCTVTVGSSTDIGLFRVFVTTHPVQYNEQRAHSLCQVETPSNLINITISLKPYISDGVVFSYQGAVGIEVRLELRSFVPHLILSRNGRELVNVGSGRRIYTDEYTPITVTVNPDTAMIEVGGINRDRSIRGRNIDLPSNGDLALMGEKGGSRGLTGVVAALEVNGALEKISACSAEYDHKTNYNPCEVGTCGGDKVGMCVPAPTLLGYYCYCKADGMPAMQCDANGFSVRQSIESNSFIMQHFAAIFGRDSYDSFQPIRIMSGGVFAVGSNQFFSTSIIDQARKQRRYYEGFGVNGQRGRVIQGGGGGGVLVQGNGAGIIQGGRVIADGGGSGFEVEIRSDGSFDSARFGGMSQSGASARYSGQSNYTSRSSSSSSGRGVVYNVNQPSGGGSSGGGRDRGSSGGGGDRGSSGGGGDRGSSGGGSFSGLRGGGGYGGSGGGGGDRGSSGGGGDRGSSGGGGDRGSSGGGSFSDLRGGGGYGGSGGGVRGNGLNGGGGLDSGGPTGGAGGSSGYVAGGGSLSGGQSGGGSGFVSRGTVYSAGHQSVDQSSGSRQQSNSQSSGSGWQIDRQSSGGSWQINSQSGGIVYQPNQPFGGQGDQTPYRTGRGTVYNVVRQRSKQNTSASVPSMNYPPYKGVREVVGPRRGDIARSFIQNDQPYDSSADQGIAPMQPQVEEGHTASFKSGGYLQLPRAFTNWMRKGAASFEIRTTISDGLVLYHGDREGAKMEDSEYIALALQDGYMEMSYRLSRSLEPTQIRHNVKVNDGNHHRVSFSKNRGEATLVVDGVAMKGSHRSSYLAAPGDLFIGGVPDASMVSSMYSNQFTGCISNVRTSAYENSRKNIDLFKNLVNSDKVSNTC